MNQMMILLLNNTFGDDVSATCSSIDDEVQLIAVSTLKNQLPIVLLMMTFL